MEVSHPWSMLVSAIRWHLATYLVSQMIHRRALQWNEGQGKGGQNARRHQADANGTATDALGVAADHHHHWQAQVQMEAVGQGTMTVPPMRARNSSSR